MVSDRKRRAVDDCSTGQRESVSVDGAPTLLADQSRRKCWRDTERASSAGGDEAEARIPGITALVSNVRSDGPIAALGTTQ